MTRPRIVLFDLGKVLIHFDWSIAARQIAPRSRFTPEDLLQHMRVSPLLSRYESGAVDREQFFREVQREIAYQGTLEEFGAFFADIFSEIPEMIALHARVRAAGYPTFIFSNTNDLAVSHIRRHYPFFKNFDGYFFSYELGVMKPHAPIYEAAERATGRAGPEILYLDDFPENSAAGAARGWQSILHVAPEQTIPRVEQILGLKPAHGTA
jgi:glucose-1-phosphatase